MDQQWFILTRRMTQDSVNPTTVGSDVFVSYASQDAAVANSIVENLEPHGLKCWLAPRDVKPGAQYADAIVGAINEAKAMVLVLSHSAITSSHVAREVERAASKHKPIIAFRIDADALNRALEYFLSNSQWIDVPALGMPEALAKLIGAVGQVSVASEPANPWLRAELKDPAHGIGKRPVGVAKRVVVAMAVVLAFGGVLMLALHLWSASHSSAQIPAAPVSSGSQSIAPISDKSIAVLPFADMSEKKDQEYFADGLSEELIDHLAHNPDLKVIARTSSFAFKGKNEDMRSIATKLGVANLLEGSIRKSGGALRITVQLIRASDGVHLWSEIYDRKLTDIFKVQDEISTTVAKALNAALNEAAAAGAKRTSNETNNPTAYNLLLQGNYFWDRGDQGDNARAVERFRQALKLDPRYALAWAKLARVYAWQGNVGELTANDAMDKVRDAVERALAIDPNCATAYFARGNVLYLVAGDWQVARSDFERAVALDPHGETGSDAQRNILEMEVFLRGRLGDVIDFTRRHLERNPLDIVDMGLLAFYQLTAGQLDDSTVTSRKLLDLNPAYATAQAQYGLTLLLMGKSAEALAAVEKEPDEATKLQALTCIYWAMGRRAESDSALGALERGFADRNEYMIAAAHAYRGEADAAFMWLDRAYQQRRGTVVPLKVDPLFRKVHGDPRFDALLRKLKLTE
jgi:TolB-like protein